VQGTEVAHCGNVGRRKRRLRQGGGRLGHFSERKESLDSALAQHRAHGRDDIVTWRTRQYAGSSIVLGENPSPAEGPWARCGRLKAGLRDDYPNYRGLGTMSHHQPANGHILCDRPDIGLASVGSNGDISGQGAKRRR